MSKKLNELITRFPHIIKIYDQNNRNPMAMFGFECDDGWFNLLEELFIGIENEMQTWSHDDIVAFSVNQVKEKFGTLRFYVSGANDNIYQLISKAEEKSAYTCEVCGNPGRTRTGGWIQVLCREHYLKRSTKRFVDEVIKNAEIVDTVVHFGEDAGKPVRKIVVKPHNHAAVEDGIAKILKTYVPDRETHVFKVGQIVKCNMDQAKIDFGSFEGTTVHSNLLKDAETFRFKVVEITLNGYKMVRVHDNHPMPDVSTIDAHKLFEEARDPNGNENNTG